MNKTAIKNFAIWARNKLIADITYKAGLLGITDKEIKKPLPQSTPTVQFFDIGTKEPYSIAGTEIEQRKKLAEEIQKKANQEDYKTAYMSVIEEVAYTWFNRLIAVRFMEVNDYLPTHIRVLSSESNTKLEPDLVTHPFDADLNYTPYEKDRIIKLNNDNKLDELFRMLFIKQCNELNVILPELFEKTNDYTELLLNVSFTDKDGVIYRLVYDIDEDDFNVSKEGQVEIIGWMYQYYNTEPKDETFALLKKNVKISKERIPAATQLFTPDWIVRYMVENSLGRLWLEGHTNDDLKSQWKYYLDEVEQEIDVKKQLNAIREEYKTIKLEDIKLIDPCMGSGHILVYAFDVLMQIYESYGYSQRDAAKSIVENNLYGLDIDNRAYQLAYFAVMMKAKQYNRHILNKKIRCHLYAIQESNEIKQDQLSYFGTGMSVSKRENAIHQLQYLLDIMTDAKEYGSILNVENLDWDLLYTCIDNIDHSGQVTINSIDLDETQRQLYQLVDIAYVLAQKYDVVITNPPYMGTNGMSAKLSDYIKKNYPDSKSDMFAVFIEKCHQITSNIGYQAMITQPSFMFLTSFEKLRSKIIKQNTIMSLLHMGRGIFGIDFGSTSFVIKKQYILNYTGCYFRLHERTFQYIDPEDISKLYLMSKGNLSVKYDFSKYDTKTEDISKDDFSGKELQIYYETKQESFAKIPGTPIAYWASAEILNLFDKPNIDNYVLFRQGMATSDNDRFLKYWHEVEINKICFDAIDLDTAENSHKKWFPYNKGGAYRKWYGNNEYVVNWENDGAEMKEFTSTLSQGMNVRLKSREYYFKECYSWSKISSGEISFRYYPTGFAFDVAGCCVFECGSNLKYFLGLSNSVVTQSIASLLSPTLNYELDHLKKVPVIIDDYKRQDIEELTNQNIQISQRDWDSFETSWDFVKHPLLRDCSSIADSYTEWKSYAEINFNQLKLNEEKLNDIFIEIYNLKDVLMPSVDEQDIIMRKAEYELDIRSFISYAIGCMFGRYNLDTEGLAYAGGIWDSSKYTTFAPNKDNIIPITDEEYLKDDVVGLFCTFLKKTFGEDTLEDNLEFIAKALGNRGDSPREVIRNYFLKDFFKDHCKIYKKRPIYWLFDSGKSDGFKALIYMHRYNENTIGNLRIDYLHKIQRVYENEIIRMQEIIENSNNTREVVVATKRKEKLIKQLKETKEYDEKIAHLALARISIDLDDGVKANYEKVQIDTYGKKHNILAKI